MWLRKGIGSAGFGRALFVVLATCLAGTRFAWCSLLGWLGRAACLVLAVRLAGRSEFGTRLIGGCIPLLALAGSLARAIALVLISKVAGVASLVLASKLANTRGLVREWYGTR